MHGTKPCGHPGLPQPHLGLPLLLAGRFAKVSLKGNCITDHPPMGSAGLAGMQRQCSRVCLASAASFCLRFCSRSEQHHDPQQHQCFCKDCVLFPIS